MDGTVRATCPGCRSPLRIPAQWVGQAVRCKKCGAVVRSKPKADAPAGHAPANVFSLDDEPQPVATGNGGGFEAVQNGTRRRGHVYRAKRPLVVWNLGGHRRLDGEGGVGMRVVQHHVDAARALGR